MGALLGPLLMGAMWGAGAGAVLIFAREGAPGLRTAAKSAIRAYVVVAKKAAEGRDTLDDLYAEAKNGGSPAPLVKHQRVPIARDEAEEPAPTRRSPRTVRVDEPTKAPRARSHGK